MLHHCLIPVPTAPARIMQALRNSSVQQRALGSNTLVCLPCTFLHTSGLRHARQAAVPLAPRLLPNLPTQQQQQQQRSSHIARITPFDQAWGTQIDGQSLASQLFAMSLFPYLAFLFFLTRSGNAPRLMLFGFYFLLAFVGATIPAGIYAKTHYGTSLANVDWLHGGAESLLTVTNLLIVLGLRQGIREAEAKNAEAAAAAAAAEQMQLGTPASNGTGAQADAPGVTAGAAGQNKAEGQ